MSGREGWPKSQEDDKDTIKSRYPEPQKDTAFNANTPERGDSITASHTFPETTRNLSLCLLSLSCEGENERASAGLRLAPQTMQSV